MNKYIIELLKTESTVIIPDFGALMGSGKSLMFNGILKFNDGKLQNYIAEKEGKDPQEVLNMIASHVRDIQTDLDKGNTYTIFGLGSFSKNENDKIVFSPEGSVIEEEQEEEQVIAPIINVDTDNIEQVKDEVEEVLSKPEEIKEEVVQESIVGDVIEKKEEKKEEKIVTAKETPIVTAKTSEKKDKLKKEKPKKEKKKRKGMIVWLIILLLLAGGGTFVGLKWKEVNNWIASFTGEAKELTDDISLGNTNSDEEINNVDDNPIITDSIEEETIDSTMLNEEDIMNEEEVEEDESNSEEETKDDIEEETEQQEEEIIMDETPLSSDLNYHILVGAFGNKSNAEGLVDKLKEAGFSNARILPGGGLSKVVAGSWSSRSEAKEYLDKAQEFNDGAYVMKK